MVEKKRKFLQREVAEICVRLAEAGLSPYTRFLTCQHNALIISHFK